MPRNEKTARTDDAAEPTKRTRKAAAQDAAADPTAAEPTKRTRKRGVAQLAAEGQQEAPAAESQQDAPGAIPTGIITRVVDPAEVVWDPNVDSGREEDEYDPAKNEKMAELMAAMKASAEESGLPYGNDAAAKARFGPNGELYLVTGRRRHRGAKLLGLMFKVEIEPVMSLRRARITATTENVHQAGVSEFGEARQYAALLADGMNERELAGTVGKSQSHINKRVAVLDLPLFVQARIRARDISFATAYDALNGFRKLPEEAATKAWATLARAWEHMKKPVTVESLRTEMYTIVRTLSRPLDGGRLIGTEVAPRFDLAAHDAGCDCGRPEIKLSDHVKPAPRCYKPDRWDALQAEANRARDAKKANGNGNSGASVPGSASRKAAAPSSAPVGPSASAPTVTPDAPSSSTPAASTAEAEAPTPSLYPTFAEFRSAYPLQAESMVLVREFRPDAIGSAILSPVLVDWNELPPAGNGSDDSVRIIYGPHGTASFSIVCVDDAVMLKAKSAAREAVRQRAAQLRERDHARFSEAVAEASKGNNAEVLAWIVGCAGDVPPAFGANTAQMLGLDVPQSASVEEIAALPKGMVTRILQAMAYRMSQGDIEWHHDDAGDRAREEIRAEYAADFAAYMNSFPMPGEDGAQQDAGAQDAPATAEAEAQQDGAEQDAEAQDAPATTEAEAQQDGAEQDAGAQDAPTPAEAQQQDGGAPRRGGKRGKRR